MVRLTEGMQVSETEFAEDAESYKLTVEATGVLLTTLRADALPEDDQFFRRMLWLAHQNDGE